MLKEVQVCLKRLDVVGGKSFLQKQSDTNSAAKTCIIVLYSLHHQGHRPGE